MYDIKWKNDLKMYIKTFNNFVFEGNVNDLQPVETNDGYKYLPLNEAIAELYGEDYCVVFYDHTKLSGKAIPDAKNDDEDNPSDTPPVYDESWFNSFVFYEGSKKIFASSGDKIDSPNIALFLEYYKEAYSKKIDESSTKNLQSDITKDMRRIYDAMSEFETKRAEDTYKEAKPFLFILPDVSRYMTTPGSPSEKENSILMILFNATQIMGTQCKLMLFVDKMNDLPTWFESENNNSAIKKIFLPSPDSKFRETFYRLEMRPIMQEMSDDELDSKIQFAIQGKSIVKYKSLQIRDSKEGIEYIKSVVTSAYLRRDNNTQMRFRDLTQMLLKTALFNSMIIGTEGVVKSGQIGSIPFIERLTELVSETNNTPTIDAYLFCLNTINKRTKIEYNGNVDTLLNLAHAQIKAEKGDGIYVKFILDESINTVIKSMLTQIRKVPQMFLKRC